MLFKKIVVMEMRSYELFPNDWYRVHIVKIYLLGVLIVKSEKLVVKG